MEDNPKGSVTLRPVRKTICKKKPKAINVDKNLSEAVQKRVNGLVSMFIGMGAYKPAGILTDNLKVEWKQTCRRIAEKKVKDAEKATIDRVVNTWLALRSFLQSRGRPAPPEMVDLDQFLNHTQAPSRALQALKWMNKNADQDRAGKLASACNTQGDWAAWASTSGRATTCAGFGGPHRGDARSRR